jgi:hypothetical protein
MDENFCWNCGHAFDHHRKIDGGCAYGGGEVERCDCPGYEDAEYSGHQRKRDLYTLSDRRRLSKKSAGW